MHSFKATERVPGWCVRCGEACWTEAHVAPHEAWKCRPETCGGTDYDPCPGSHDTPGGDS